MSIVLYIFYSKKGRVHYTLPSTFRSNNHFRKCVSHPAHKIPLALHIGL